MWNKLCNAIGMFFAAIVAFFLTITIFVFYTVIGTVIYLIAYSPLIVTIMIVIFLFSLIL